MSEYVTVYRLEIEGGGAPLVVEDLETLMWEIDASGIGTRYTITVEEWRRSDLQSLPEWDGW